MAAEVPVSVSFLPDWFERHYFDRQPRPETASDGELARLYLARKRFQFEEFGEFDLGEAQPVMDGKQVNRIGQYCCDLVPYLLGVELQCIDAGFYYPQPLSAAAIAKLKPVDLAGLPLGEWIARRRDRLVGLYGSAEMGLYLEGSLNGAARIRGEDVYADLLLNRELVRHLFEVINETVLMAYRFLKDHVGLQRVVLFNCTVNHISPDLYGELCLENDIHVAREIKKMIGDCRLHLHHCDLPAERYLNSYEKIPHLNAMDGSHTSDIRQIKDRLGQVDFLAMVNPVILDQSRLAEFELLMDRLLIEGADAIVLAHLDPNTSIDRVRSLLRIVQRCCQRRGRRPEFAMAALAEEEVEWAFPRYQGTGRHHCSDHWSQLVPTA